MTTSRRILSLLFAILLVLAAVAPAYAYNGENNFHVRLNAPQHIGCGEAAPLVATVTDKTGDPRAGVIVSFVKHQGSPGDSVAPASDITDADGDAESTYTIACGSEPGARVIKACEPAGACATTVVVCRQSDGCTGNGHGGGLILPKGEAASGTPAAIDQSDAASLAVVQVEPTSAGPTSLLNLLGIGLFSLLAAVITRSRPKALRAATAG